MRAAFVALLTLLVARAALADPPPPRMLWAWERPEDLRFVPANVGVAFLQSTVTVTSDGAVVARRRQPLRVRPDTWLMAVVHVELRPRGAPWSLAVQRAVRDAMVTASREPGVRGVQIDFDAPRSRRGDYRALLTELRGALPTGVWLSMTALASWCLGDAWIDAPPPPVDEVVPMAFTMGRGGPAVLSALRASHRFTARVCRGSVGWAANEPGVWLDGVTRQYVYNPRAWTAATAAAWMR